MIEDTLANEVGAPVRGRLEVQEPDRTSRIEDSVSTPAAARGHA